MSDELDSIERVGGRLCLDFVNSRSSHFAADAREYFDDYAGLLRWMRGCADGFDAAGAARLRSEAAAHPRRAASAFAQARATRERLYRVLAGVARGEAAAHIDLTELDRELQAALAQRRLQPAGATWRWAWRDADALELPAWQALVSAADLLAHDDLARLKQCPAPDGCGWLFYDVSKNQTRRWCSMRMCGNTAKSRRFQRRWRET